MRRTLGKLIQLLTAPGAAPHAEHAAPGSNAASHRPAMTPSRLDFDDIFQRNGWGSDESRSGEGSELGQTARLREALPRVFRELGVSTVLDIPCGDFNWMRHVNLEGIEYTGGDVVAEIARRNQNAYATPARRFLHLDLVGSKLPRADLVFCRDCLVHLPYADIAAALENIRGSNAAWLATTTFTRRHENQDLFGIWRPLNLLDAPFNFPEPHMLIEEGLPPGEDADFSDKSIGIWRVEDLPRIDPEVPPPEQIIHVENQPGFGHAG